MTFCGLRALVISVPNLVLQQLVRRKTHNLRLMDGFAEIERMEEQTFTSVVNKCLFALITVVCLLTLLLRHKKEK